VAAGIIFHTSISLVTVNMFVRCFPKISTSSFPDIAGILHSALTSGGLGVNFLPAKGFKRGPPHCVERTFLIAVVG